MNNKKFNFVFDNNYDRLGKTDFGYLLSLNMKNNCEKVSKSEQMNCSEKGKEIDNEVKILLTNFNDSAVI